MGVREEDRLLSIPEGEISVIGTGVERSDAFALWRLSGEGALGWQT